MVFLFCLLATTAHADEEWFKYYFPAEPREAAVYRGAPVSMFGAGRDVLDAPAGRHGFTLARDGHFYFAVGARARFWGTNLCFDACFPVKKQAEMLAVRIAYFGFNAARPHTLTEWNHCYPNEYACETPLLLARAARENDWDALFQFAFAHSGRNIENVSNIDSYFNINPNAQQLILCSFGSRIFLKNEPVAFDITEDRAVVRYGKYTVEVGKIKSTGSGWGQDGRFDWGRSPTLMKQVD